ncbi:MAG: 50S ribosomal protein L22 [Deltaproteobacteria bacterium]|nr:50S ribosomal protein L22 [Deltaproteobacteria bacterium]
MSKQATLRYLRISARKVRAVAAAVRGVAVGKAMDYLNFSQRGSAKPLAKLLKSAIVNASQEKGVDIDKLYVKELQVNVGPTMKRWMPRAKGSATQILKRTSHVTMVLGEK